MDYGQPTGYAFQPPDVLFVSITTDLLGSSANFDEFDSRIATLELWPSWSPYSHQKRHINFALLSDGQLQRYNLSEQPEDFDKAILHLTEAVFLPLPPLVDSDVCTCVVFCFSQLAQLFIDCFYLMSQPEDLSTPLTTFAIFINRTYVSTPSAFRVVKSSSNLSRHWVLMYSWRWAVRL